MARRENNRGHGEGYEPSGLLKENGKSVDAKGDAALRRLTQIAALCNNSELSQQEAAADPKKRKSAKGELPVSETMEWTIKGDPTEAALLVLAAKTGLVKSALQSLYTRVKEFPFDAERKRMSVLVSHQGGKLVCAKGAPDLLVSQCAYVLWDDQVVPFTASLKTKVLAANEAMARESLRVLGMAYRDVKGHETCESGEQAESGLIFAGLTGMMDPPRKEVKEAIYKCRQAGIKTVMITGDHGTTAEAIARTLGIIGREGASSPEPSCRR